MKHTKNIQELKKEIDRLYMELVSDPQFKHATALGYVYQNYLSVFDSVANSHTYLAMRQKLVELHFLKVPIPLSIHEEYHQVSHRLQEETINSFLHAKTLLNAITQFIGEIIPESDRSNASVDSFGAFYYDCKKKPLPSNRSAAQIFLLYRTDGEKLNQSVNHYRNKFIEHSHTLSSGTLSTGPSKLQIIHQKDIKGPVYLIRSPEDDVKASHRFLDDIVILTNNQGKTSAYVHILRDAALGRVVKKYDIVGIPFDGTGVHFLKYGPHYHFFPYCIDDSAPKNVLRDSATDSPEIIEHSPDLFGSFEELTVFLKSILLALKNYMHI